MSPTTKIIFQQWPVSEHHSCTLCCGEAGLKPGLKGQELLLRAHCIRDGTKVPSPCSFLMLFPSRSGAVEFSPALLPSLANSEDLSLGLVYYLAFSSLSLHWRNAISRDLSLLWQGTVKALLTATSWLWWPLYNAHYYFFVLMDSPYIDSFPNLSTTATATKTCPKLPK